MFFCIAFYTGLRKGEIHALRWANLKDGCLSVTRSIAQKLRGGDRETPPKNKSSIRTIQIPAPLIDVLADHKARCTQIDGFADTHHVCGGARSLRDSTIQNRNVAYARAAGLRAIRIHDFRHSHASVLVNNGINIQEVARRLGHAKIEETWNTYSHLYPREEERAVKILNEIV
ncbi:MAG: site-specific integrase [Oscillospiraceae bacterium]|nr:site-specific integrase [Oscillospiraceae bacterium]